MHHRFARTGSLLALVLLLTIALGACGGKGGNSGGSSAADGAATPQELVERMRKAADTKDFGEVIPLIHPEHRSAITFFLGVFPPLMMVGMMEGMSGMAAMGGPEKEKEAKDKIAALKKGWEDLQAEYKIDINQESASDPMKAMGPGSTAEDRAAAFKELDKLLGHVDHAAFIKASMAFLEKNSDDKEDGVSTSSWEKFDIGEVDIQIDGDKATVTEKGKDDKIGLAKVNGRWYIDVTTLD